jgi:hypothetical protein
MQKVNGRQMTEDGCQVMAKAHIAFGKVTSLKYAFCDILQTKT